MLFFALRLTSRCTAVVIFLFVAGFSAWCEDFPVISRLDTRDPVFRQYVDNVDHTRRLIFGRQTDPQLVAEGFRVFSYMLSTDDDIYRLAARCNIPYAALATLNRIAHPSSLPPTLLLPTAPGVFIPENPSNDLEQILASSRSPEEGVIITIKRGKETERFCFFPGEDFRPTERACFLNAGFRFPLQNYRITSDFGLRSSPFTGRIQRHQGLDLAAPLGTNVYPTRDGTVAEMGSDSVYGNYIIIAHNDNWVSLYGHLSAIKTTAHSKVGRNTVIGAVGSTGQSTGPHLHFEIRKSGTAMDPGKLLFKSGN
ncbi:peptidase M23 [Spirochaetia bacterium]|nr:peptidase M23 [Spirochaetia bacterium]